MRQIILAAALLGALAASGGVLAHEGHHHDAMGTVEAIDAKQMTLAVSEEETLTFALTEETEYVRGDESVSREDVATGERAVVMYQKKDDVNTAIKVKLAPKSE